MKESKIVKVLCYMILPVCILLIIFNSLYIFLLSLDEGVLENSTSDFQSIEESQSFDTSEEIDIGNAKDFDEKENKAEIVQAKDWEIFWHQLVQKWGRVPIFCMPIFIALAILSFLYLLISAGHEKGKPGIYLNAFDKIPFDVLLVGNLLMLVLIAAVLSAFDFGYCDNLTSLYTILMVVLIAYFCVYGIIISLIITFVKRLKANTWLKNNLLVMGLTGIWRIVKKVARKILEFFHSLFRHLNLNVKILLQVFGILFLSTFLICNVPASSGSTLPLLFILLGFLSYTIVKKVSQFCKIKEAIKALYEGNEKIRLEENEFKGELKEISGYLNDISGGFLNAIEQGIKSEKMKAELITNVSHDIKTPLTSIINYVDLLKKEEIQNEKAKEYIRILEQKSQRLKRLTEDLIEASKISSGNITLTMTKINLVELLKQTIGEFEERLKEKNLEVVYQLKWKGRPHLNALEEDHTGVYIYADSRYIYRIIENLYTNICKYALENSRVYIDLMVEDAWATIALKNISREKLNISEEELMQRFVRGDKARTTEGSGLGLSIAKSLTELQEGAFALSIDGDLFKVTLKFQRIQEEVGVEKGTQESNDKVLNRGGENER